MRSTVNISIDFNNYALIYNDLVPISIERVEVLGEPLLDFISLIDLEQCLDG
jgi:hypothetical protein